MDAWQYAMHRAFHENKFLYRNFHSHHHRLYVPYAYGALYNHPVEGESITRRESNSQGKVGKG